MNETIVRILLATAAGLTVGWVCCENVYRRKNAQAMAALLRRQTTSASSPDTTQRQLRQIRSVVNDIHKRIMAVTKGLKKPAA